jgi:hypothetical protein
MYLHHLEHKTARRAAEGKPAGPESGTYFDRLNEDLGAERGEFRKRRVNIGDLEDRVGDTRGGRCRQAIFENRLWRQEQARPSEIDQRILECAVWRGQALVNPKPSSSRNKVVGLSANILDLHANVPKTTIHPPFPCFSAAVSIRSKNSLGAIEVQFGQTSQA